MASYSKQFGNKIYTPSQRLGVYMCFPSGWFLLTWQKSRSPLCPVHHQTEVCGGKPWMARWAWSSPGYWMQCRRFSIALKANSKIPLRNCSPCLSLSSSLIRHEFPISFASQRHNQNWLKKRRVYPVCLFLALGEGVEVQLTCNIILVLGVQHNDLIFLFIVKRSLWCH